MVELLKIARCSGITTVLTMTFMGLEARKDLPKVTYPTALDYFVFISFMYIFCTVVQVRQDRDSLQDNNNNIVLQSLAWFIISPRSARANIIWRSWKMRFVGKMISTSQRRSDTENPHSL